MVALAGGLHRRLGAESVMLRLNDKVLHRSGSKWRKCLWCRRSRTTSRCRSLGSRRRGSAWCRLTRVFIIENATQHVENLRRDASPKEALEHAVQGEGLVTSG